MRKAFNNNIILYICIVGLVVFPQILMAADIDSVSVLKSTNALNQYESAELVYYYEWQDDWTIQYQLMQEFNDQEFIEKKQKNLWVDDIADFRNNRLESSTYTSEGLLETFLVTEWNIEYFRWDSISRTTYKYNSAGNVLEELKENYDGNLRKWQKATIKEYSYFPGGSRLDHMIQRFYVSENSEWMNRKRVTYEVSEDGEYQEYSDWVEDSSEWINAYSISKSFNLDGKVETSLTKNWSLDNTEWLQNKKDSTVYDAAGNRTQFISYLWDEDSLYWYVNQNTEYKYFKGQLIEKIDSYYDLLLDEVIQKEREVLSYAIDSTWKETEIYSWNQSDSYWQPSALYTRHFINPFPTTIETLESEGTAPLVYPNPFSHQIHFKLAEGMDNVTVEIYALDGKPVYRGLLNSLNYSINTASLKRGFYLIHLISASHRECYKYQKIR